MMPHPLPEPPAEAEPVPAEAPPRRGPAASSRDRLQTLANVLTILVALCAIGLSIWEGYETREFNRLSVLPNLEPIEASFSHTGPIDHEYFRMLPDMDSLYAMSYALENTGLGPAHLQRILVFEGGEEVYDSAQQERDAFLAVLEGMKRDLDALPFATAFLKDPYAAGDMLQAGQVHDFLALGIPFASVAWSEIEERPPDIVEDEVLEQRSFVFCYCSVYGEDCAMTYLGGEPPSDDVCGF